MLKDSKIKLASLALAGGLAVALSGAASAQDWQAPSPAIHRVVYHRATERARNQLRNGAFYHHPYRYYGHYGYYGYGPVGVAGAIVGAGLGAADTAVAAATGYPYYGYGYYGPYGYDPYYGNGWWGPYHNQYYDTW